MYVWKIYYSHHLNFNNKVEQKHNSVIKKLQKVQFKKFILTD